MARSPRAADVTPDRATDTQRTGEITSGGNRDRIAERAYERYESRGRQDGNDQEDWFEAEREFEQSPSGSATTDERGDDGDDAA